MFTHTKCDPEIPDVVNLGAVPNDDLSKTFEQFPWNELIAKMKALPKDKVCFSPSLGFQLPSADQKIEISYVESRGTEHFFYLFYIRPKEVKKLFGLVKHMNTEFTSDILDQKIDDCLKLIELFTKQDFDAIEQMFR